MSARQTKFHDACRTVDELKRLLSEEYERVIPDPSGVMSPLLEDAVFMLEKMKKRLKGYKNFQKKVQKILLQVARVEDVEVKKAKDAVAFLHRCIRSKENFRKNDVEKMGRAIEAIRSVAGAQERSLRSYKDLALKIYDLFMEIKGNRPWLITEDKIGTFVQTLERKYQAWLPPEPHKSILLDELGKASACVLEGSRPSADPIVQFEDGGSMPMSQVRWDPETGETYRGKSLKNIKK